MSPPPDIARPYPGIRPFLKSEYAIFYGRRPMIDEVLNLLGQKQLVVVHGASGCGKSSLIKAGVLPRLEREHRLHGIEWVTAEMRPGGGPILNLAEGFARLASGADPQEKPDFDLVRKLRGILNRGPEALKTIAEIIGAEEGRNVCLLIDQFEELFRFTEEISREESELFTSVLRGFAQDPPPGLHVIVTMRSDFLGDCAQFVGFAELVNQTQYLLPRLDEMQMMRAITQPARDFGGDVDRNLAMRLIAESRRISDSLPLVQHCLMYLWAEASKQPAPEDGGPHPVLTLDGFPGLNQTLSAQAEEVMARLESDWQGYEMVAGHLFRALINVDAQGRATRRPIRKSALVDYNRPDALDRVLSEFSNPDIGFIFVSSDDDPVIDITHEALIRCWDRLNDGTIDPKTRRPRGWLKLEQEDERLWRALLVQAENDDLVGAQNLDERLSWFRSLPGPAWAERHGGGWKSVTRLLDASAKRRDQDQVLAERQQRRDRLFQGVLSGAAIALTIFTITAVVLWQKAQDSAEEATRNEQRALTAEKAAKDEARNADDARQRAEKTADALSQALQSQWRVTEQAALKDRDIDIPRATRRALVALEFLPDPDRDRDDPDAPVLPEDKTIAAALRRALSANDALDVLDFRTTVRDMALAPNGEIIALDASRGRDGLFYLSWSKSGEAKGPPVGLRIQARRATLMRPVFSPDSAYLFGLDNSRVVVSIDTATGRRIAKRNLRSPSKTLTLSADGRTLAIGLADGRVLLAEAPGLTNVVEVPVSTVSIEAIALDPEGQRFAAIDRRGQAGVYSPSGSKIQEFEAVRQRGQVQWSPDGQYLAISGDKTVTLLNGADFSPHKSIPTPRDAAAFAFSHDSRKLAILQSRTRRVEIHEIATASILPSATTADRATGTGSIAWLPNNRQFVVQVGRGSLAVFDAEIRNPVPEGISTENLVALAKQRIDVCFSEIERERLKLFAAKPPQWCIDRKLHPFDAKGRIETGQEFIIDGDREDDLTTGLKLIHDGIVGQELGQDYYVQTVLSALFQRSTRLVREGDLEGARAALDQGRHFNRSEFDAMSPSRLQSLVRGHGRSLLSRDTRRARSIFKLVLDFRPELYAEILSEHVRHQRSKDPEVALLLALELLTTGPLPTEDTLRQDPLISHFLGDGTVIATGARQTAIYGVAFPPGISDRVAWGDINRAKRDQPLIRVSGLDGKDRTVELGAPTGTDRIGIRRLAFNSDGTKVVATITPDKVTGRTPGLLAAITVDMTRGSILTMMNGSGLRAFGVDWSPHDRLIATGTESGLVQIWDAPSGARIKDLNAGGKLLYGVAFDPTSAMLATGGGNRKVQIWDIASGTIKRSHDRHDASIRDIKWGRKTNTIASVDYEGRLVLWRDPENAEPDEPIVTGHNAYALAFSPDEDRVAVAGRDSITIFRVADRTEILRIPNSRRTYSIAWSPDGSALVTGNVEGQVVLWDIDGDTVLLARLKQRVRRCLNEKERASFLLRKAKPEWCDEFE